jgi:anti-sigma regulatory factor (Ser/Thr protein kinase)
MPPLVPSPAPASALLSISVNRNLRCAATSNSALCRSRCPAPGCMPGTCCGEWGLNGLASDSELLVSELVTNAVKATAGRDEAAVRLRLSGGSARVLIEVWDADPRAPASEDLGERGTPDPQQEGGRGLFLVAALSARWDWYPTREPCGQGCLVRDTGFIAPRGAEWGRGGNHRSFG